MPRVARFAGSPADSQPDYPEWGRTDGFVLPLLYEHLGAYPRHAAQLPRRPRNWRVFMVGGCSQVRGEPGAIMTRRSVRAPQYAPGADSSHDGHLAHGGAGVVRETGGGHETIDRRTMRRETLWKSGERGLL